jgi:hypothetical protein
MIRSTYTYAVLEISQAAYDDIAAKLKAAGYDHAFHENDQHGTVIDMHGIAVSAKPLAIPAFRLPESWTAADTATRLDLIEKEGYNAVGEFEVQLMIREIRSLQAAQNSSGTVTKH